MQLRAIEPSGIYPTGGDYLHALEVSAFSRMVYVAGTMGLDVRGMPGADLETQLPLVWSNIAAILTKADMSVDNIVRVTSYLTDRAQAEANRDARLAALGGRIVPTTAIVVGTLEAGWLIEIEVIAAGSFDTAPKDAYRGSAKE